MTDGPTCDYKPNSIEPCDTCPRVMSAFPLCEFLKESYREAKNDLS